ncbi:amino acid synthesis family protein [Oceanicola sp. S124]|uniref:amino acid synthesis family protein n=1 Tax=Oceanicola sp. S124 TaxID=1042378 RepID=UPI000255A701|nr:amino acid synthesis family protein [Oceanicola sp. S124]
MAEFTLRKTQIILEEIHHDGGPVAEVPRLRGAVLALVRNPYAGVYQADLTQALEDLKPLGLMMAQKLVDAMGGAEGIDSYGKGGIAGEAGELEHAALWHVAGGYSMREVLGESLAIVPSSKKQGGPGTRLDVPMGHTNAAYVRSHFDAMEVGLPEGPRADELLYVLTMAKGPRVHARLGGLAADQISKFDGLR